jgi:excisionase family DNA binding protein
VVHGVEGNDFLTVREVAHHLRVSTMTVYRLIKSGDLASTRVGKGYRIRAGDLDAYLRAASGGDGR